MSRARIEERSRLDVDRERLWARITTPAGVGDELRPLLRMTVPPRLRGGLGNGGLPTGEVLGRSWILLFGLVPIDYDDITVVRLDPGRGFLERSPMLSQRFWQHERTLDDAPDGTCVVTDRVEFEPRLPVPAAWLAPVVRTVFRHRHRRLRRRFGGRPA
jgi:hypothetical protein